MCTEHTNSGDYCLDGVFRNEAITLLSMLYNIWIIFYLLCCSIFCMCRKFLQWNQTRLSCCFSMQLCELTLGYHIVCFSFFTIHYWYVVCMRFFPAYFYNVGYVKLMLMWGALWIDTIETNRSVWRFNIGQCERAVSCNKIEWMENNPEFESIYIIHNIIGICMVCLVQICSSIHYWVI